MDNPLSNPTRRAFLTAGGLVMGFAVVPKAIARAGIGDAKAGAPGLVPMNAFVKIGRDDTVTILSKHLEWGQGIFTGLAALVAEELDADWAQMRAVHSAVDDQLYANLGFLELGFRFQGTFGSSGMPNSFLQYRQAGAAVRAMMVEAAARKWGVPASSVTVSDGVVSHAASNRQSGFGGLVDIAARIVPPAEPALKKPEDFRFIGRDMPRLDSADKTTGATVYTQDLAMPGMVVSLVRHADHFGATVKSFNDAETRKIPGVVDVKQVPTGVAVYATDTWSAIKGRNALRVEWDMTQAETRSSAELESYYRSLVNGKSFEAVKKGDVDRSLEESSSRKVETSIVFPFLAHAPMETMDAILAPTGGGGLDIFAGSQIGSFDRDAAAQVLGISSGKVKVQTQYAGGGFGRRAGYGAPFMVEAANVFKAAGGSRVVKHVHMRDDDLRTGGFRPLYLHDMKGAVDGAGKIVAWDHMVVGQTITPTDELDFQMVEGLADQIYTVPNFRVRTHNVKIAAPTMPWRGVAYNHTCFAVESFVDQLLEKGGLDPVEGRLAHLEDERAKVVLRRAAEMANWGKSTGSGSALGVSLVKAYKTYTCQIAQVSRDEDGLPRVEKVWCSIDCGLAVNPDMIRTQIEGGISFGLGADLYSAITLEQGGRIRETNFSDYRVLRLREMPEVEVAIIDSKAAPTGVGELGGPPTGAAVANAWRKLTGQRIERLPMVSARS